MKQHQGKTYLEASRELDEALQDLKRVVIEETKPVMDRIIKYLETPKGMAVGLTIFFLMIGLSICDLAFGWG